MVDDVAGTPTTKKVTVANLLAGAGGEGFFDKGKLIFPTNSSNGWTETKDNLASIDYYLPYAQLDMGAAQDDDTYICSSKHIPSLPDSGKTLICGFNLWRKTSANTDAFLGLEDDGGVPFGTTDNHYGFFIDGQDLYATNGNGSSQTSTDTDVTISTSAEMNYLHAVWTQGTDIKFYCNNILEATHTTNLPSATDWYLKMGHRNVSGTGSLYLSNAFVEYER